MIDVIGPKWPYNNNHKESDMGILWDRFVAKAKDIDAWRKMHMSMAEFVDAWRLIPRLLVIGYGYMMWTVVKWYMDIEPFMIEDCDVSILKDACISQAPTTQDAVLVTAFLGVAAAVFGLYSNSGKKWNGFTPWNKPKEDDNDKMGGWRDTLSGGHQKE